jgi:hypothetical protein
VVTGSALGVRVACVRRGHHESASKDVSTCGLFIYTMISISILNSISLYSPHTLDRILPNADDRGVRVSVRTCLSKRSRIALVESYAGGQ